MCTVLLTLSKVRFSYSRKFQMSSLDYSNGVYFVGHLDSGSHLNKTKRTLLRITVNCKVYVSLGGLVRSSSRFEYARTNRLTCNSRLNLHTSRHLTN